MPQDKTTETEKQPDMAAYQKDSSQCPWCGSDQVNWDSPEIQDDQAVQGVSCASCGRRWLDIYQHIGIAPRKTGDTILTPAGRKMDAAEDLLKACQYVARWHREHDSGEGELFGLDFVTTCIAAIRQADPDWTTSTPEANDGQN